MDASVEALFVTAADPENAAGFLTDSFGAGAGETADGQRIVTGLGIYLVIEPATQYPPGTVTIWLRVGDAALQHDQLVAAGAESVSGPATVGGEAVASLRTQHGIHLGLISESP